MFSGCPSCENIQNIMCFFLFFLISLFEKHTKHYGFFLFYWFLNIFLHYGPPKNEITKKTIMFSMFSQGGHPENIQNIMVLLVISFFWSSIV